MGRTPRVRHVALFVPLVVVLIVLGAWTASATHVEPALWAGNPTCGNFGSGWTELKVEPVADGQYSKGALTVTVAVNEGDQTFDWTSNIGVDAVFAKGGPMGNLYSYDPESTGDTGLHAPFNDNSGSWYGLSHISFCFDADGSPTPSPSVSPTETTTPTPTETPSGSPTPTPTESTPGVTVSPTTVTTSPSVLGTKILGNTGADVRGMIVVAAALIALGVLAFAASRRTANTD